MQVFCLCFQDRHAICETIHLTDYFLWSFVRPCGESSPESLISLGCFLPEPAVFPLLFRCNYSNPRKILLIFKARAKSSITYDAFLEKLLVFRWACWESFDSCVRVPFLNYWVIWQIDAVETHPVNSEDLLHQVGLNRGRIASWYLMRSECYNAFLNKLSAS